MHRGHGSCRGPVIFNKSGFFILLWFAGLLGATILGSPTSAFAQPVNDNFASPTGITGTSFSDSVDVTLATTEFSDPAAGCGNGSRLRTVWYQYVAAGAATIVVDTSGSTYDTILSAYTPASLPQSVACNDDAAGNTGTSKVAVHVDPGTYYFMVSQFAPPVSGPPTLSLHAVVYTDPSYDSSQNAKVVNKLGFTDSVANYEATTGANDPVPNCDSTDNPPKRTLWYSFTASASGTIIANTTGSTYDTVLAVYTGSPGSLTAVSNSCDDDVMSALSSQVSFTATNGTTYLVMVSAFADDTGILSFYLDAPKRRGQITSQ